MLQGYLTLPVPSLKERFRKEWGMGSISSMQGTLGDFILYEGTKISAPPDYFFRRAWIINLARYFASLLGKYNIWINSISHSVLFNTQPEKFVERYSKKTFLGRMASGEGIKGVGDLHR